MKTDIIAIVLAGGVGKRFWPIKTYKSMVSFLGKPLLQHNIERLCEAGFKNIVVIANKEDKLLVENIHVSSCQLTVVVQTQPRGMADALLSARKYINNKPCLVINAEDVVDQSLYNAIAGEVLRNTSFVVGKKVREYQDLGYIRYSKDTLVEIVEKPGKGNEPSDLVNLVFHFFPDISVFLTIVEQAASDKDDVYEKALSIYAKNAFTRIISYEGPWYPLKYPWQTLDIMGYLMQTKLKNHRGKHIDIRSNVLIDGPVYIDDSVKIFENTKIVGPCFIGKGTIIGSNNIIRASHIGPECVTGFNTDITRSYVGDGCWFHSNYVGDSVLEGNVSMGAGTVLANLRLDEGEIYSVVRNEKLNTRRTKLGAIIGRNVRMGVNTSIMPGVKIGSNSLVGAGIIADHDIPDQSFCAGTTHVTIIPNTFHNASLSRDELKKSL